MPKTEINVDSGGNKTIAYAVAVVIMLLLGALTYFIYGYEDIKGKYHDVQNDNMLLSSSIGGLNDSVCAIKVKLSDEQTRYAGRINTLSMTRDNIEKLYKDKVNDCKRLGIKLSSLQSIATASAETRDTAFVPVYVDSMRFLHTSYDDGYLSMSNTIYRNNTSKLVYQYRDSFELINDVKQKHFLFFKWKKRTDRWTLLPMNPKTKVMNFRVIKLIK